MCPVYKGTRERVHPKGQFPDQSRPNARREWIIQMANDLSKSIDYLETRDDIDTERIAYQGLSLGASIAPIMLAVENRIKTAVLLQGGLWPVKQSPAVDPFNFAPRVRIPVLMINGDKDIFSPYQTSQLPLYKSLGTDEKDKKHIPYPGGHGVYKEFRTQVNEDILAWLNQYLGEVE